QKRHSPALEAFRAGLKLAPNQESLLAGAAMAAQKSNQIDDAIAYWRKVAAMDPGNVAGHANLTALAARKGDWTTVKEQCDVWLSLEPSSVDARLALVKYWLHQGDRARGQSEFTKIEAL